MKANKAITIALAGLIAACAIPFGTVFAAESGGKTTDYPVETTGEGGETVQPFEKRLTFDEVKPITDYAVSGDRIAFASYASVYLLYTGENGDRKLDDEHPYSGSNRIERLDFEGEKLYLDVKTEGIFLFPEYNRTVTHEFPKQSNVVKLSTDEEYRLSNDGLHYFFGDGHEVLGTDFYNLKVFDDKAYAIKDNVLYTFNGAEPDLVDVDYTDFKEAENILCGDVAQKLTAADYEIKTTEIKSGRYYTKINPDAIGTDAGDTFIPLYTEKANVDKPCIVLCESGKTSVVAASDGMFITATDNLNPPTPSSQKNDWAIGSDGKRLAAYASENTKVYACPFMCESTEIADLFSGADNHVEVTEKFEFGGVKFYRVKMQDGKTGFVAANKLTPYSFSAEDNEPHENGDKEFSYETNVVSVVLAIVIVALVIVAIMYISLIGSKKDKNKPQKKLKDKRSEPAEDGDDEE
ncbi:MAG: hypothetical protein NC033_02435 [Clostridiales bacterium]|nr:hypothetical protein [Clostridiales bacterium]